MTRRAVLAVDVDLKGDETADTLAANLRYLLAQRAWGWLNPEVTVLDTGETEAGL